MAKLKQSSKDKIHRIFNHYIKEDILPHYKHATKSELETIFKLCKKLETAYYDIAQIAKKDFDSSFVILFFEILEKTSKKISQEFLVSQQKYNKIKNENKAISLTLVGDNTKIH